MTAKPMRPKSPLGSDELDRLAVRPASRALAVSILFFVEVIMA